MTDGPLAKPLRNPRLLVVEDDPRLRNLLVRTTTEWGFSVQAVWSGEEADRLNRNQPFDLAILDYHLPRMNGLQALRTLRQSAPSLQAIVLTAHADLAVAQEAVHLDVVEFLIKPCQLRDLELALDRAVRKIADRNPAPLDLPAQPLPQGTGAKTLETAERELILQSLGRNNGNRAASARELGITRRTLHNKINIYQSQGYAIP